MHIRKFYYNKYHSRKSAKDNGQQDNSSGLFAKRNDRDQKKTTTLKIMRKNKPLLQPRHVNPNQISSKMISSRQLYLSKLEKKVVRAIKENKIFYIGGYNNVVRFLLRKRGWIEKLSKKKLAKFGGLTMKQALLYAYPGNIFEKIILSNMIKNRRPNFVWQSLHNHRNSLIEAAKKNFPYFNHISRTRSMNFTSKEGLISCIENSHWNMVDGLTEIRVPRFHRLAIQDEHLEFLGDYRTTYCISSIMFFCENQNRDGTNNICSEYGQISIRILEFAFKRIKSELNYRKAENLHRSISKFYLLNDRNTFTKKAWDQFYKVVNNLITGKIRLKISGTLENRAFFAESESLIKQFKVYHPNLMSDGYNNLWILKPSYSCRGNGIVIKRDFKEIMNFLATKSGTRYIVQKYIERPLLIFKTKFDIRQYTLFTINNNKYNIWMYKDCYLRFSSQEYRLNRLDRSVHVTNNAVQKLYKNGARSMMLPRHNMWSLEQFLNFLKKNYQHDENVWYNKIYPGMKKNILAIALSCINDTKFVPNTFEIYGCDFMLDENFEPILLEINSSPDLSATTIVTAKMCPTAIRDLLKVILDYSSNPSAYTGKFELIYSMNCSEEQKDIENDENLLITGQKMTVTIPIIKPTDFVTPKKVIRNVSPTNKKIRNISAGGGSIGIITEKQQSPRLAKHKRAKKITVKKYHGLLTKNRVAKNINVKKVESDIKNIEVDKILEMNNKKSETKVILENDAHKDINKEQKPRVRHKVNFKNVGVESNCSLMNNLKNALSHTTTEENEAQKRPNVKRLPSVNVKKISEPKTANFLIREITFDDVPHKKNKIH